MVVLPFLPVISWLEAAGVWLFGALLLVARLPFWSQFAVLLVGGCALVFLCVSGVLVVWSFVLRSTFDA